MSVNVKTRDTRKPVGSLSAAKVLDNVKSPGRVQKFGAKVKNWTKSDECNQSVKRRKPHSAGALQSRRKKSQDVLQNGDDENHIHSDGEGQDVKFFNIPTEDARVPVSAWGGPSRPVSAASSIVTPRDVQRINPDLILSQTQEQEYSKVYEVELQGANIAEIEKLEKFVKLRVLDLSNNFISKIQNLNRNKDIRELKLYGNRISELENLDDLKELSHLQLQFNKIKSVGKGLSCLRKLKILRLDNNRLTKLETRELVSCSNLSILDLSSNSLEDISVVNNLPNLEELTAAHNRLKCLPEMSKCKKLKELDISNNQLTDITNLKSIPGLRVLHIHNNSISDISKVGRHRYLEELLINDNRLRELHAIPLQMAALQIVDISNNHVEDFQQMIHLRGLTDIKELHMLGNPCCQENGSHGSLSSEFQLHMPNLEYLNGIQLKRNASRSSIPLMRPMSAASVVSTRLVENQMKAMEMDMEGYLSSLTQKFSNIRTGLGALPVESPRSKSSGDSRTSSAASSRPGSSRQRSRILEAQQFAAQNF